MDKTNINKIYDREKDNVQLFINDNCDNECKYGILPIPYDISHEEYVADIAYKHIEPATHEQLRRDVFDVFISIEINVLFSLNKYIYVDDLANIVLDYCNLGDIFITKNINEFVELLLYDSSTYKFYYLVNQQKCRNLRDRILNLRKKGKRDKGLEEQYLEIHPDGTICVKKIKWLIKKSEL